MRNTLLTSVAFSVLALALPAQAEEMPFLLNADEIDFSTAENIIRAHGNVEVLSEKGALQANEIIYNTETQKLIARGDVLMLDDKKAAVFSDEIEVDGAFRTATIHLLRMRMVQGPALTAKRGTATDDVYSLKNARYSACPVTGEESPAWQIRANNIVFNNEKETVTYKNAWFDVYGVPVIWVPYVTHTTNFDEPRSGILPPRFGSSGDKGQEFGLDYYYYADPTYDFTLRSRYMTKRGLMMGLENRFNTASASGNLRTSMIEDRRDDEWRGHFYGDTEWTINRGERFGFNIKAASDDTYIDDFLRDNPSYLPSEIYYESASLKHFFGINTRYYQDLREERRDSTTAQPLGNVQFERVFDVGARDRVIWNSDFMALHRSSGNRMQRLVNQVQYTRPMAFNTGDMLDFSTSLRADIYHLDPIADESNWESRVMPEASLFWQRPMMSPHGYHTVTPMIKTIVAPTNVTSSNIPNEDSVEYELDSANLFEDNRFAGYDRVEDGSRIIYGLRNDWQTGEGRRLFSIFLGQSWRADPDGSAPSTGGAGTRFSDWVGFINAQLVSNMSVSSHFRLDHANFTPRRTDSRFRYGGMGEYDNNIRLSHIYLDDGPDEARLNARYNIDRKWYTDIHAHRDLTDGGRWLRAGIALSYRHCCYTSTFSISRRGFNNRNVPPSTEFQFNIELLSLGRNTND